MANITQTDVTVVGSAYDTSGNGGRKLTRLSNGWLVAVVKKTSASPYQSIFEVSKDNGSTWAQLCYMDYGASTFSDIAIVSSGTKVYVVSSNTTTTLWFASFDATTVSNSATLPNVVSVDSGQSSMGNVTLAYSSSDNTLHAAWASKNSSYPNSFNIRYAKGTINADGSVTWGTVEQVTTFNSTNSGYYYQNPSIVVDNNSIPTIVAESGNLITANATAYNYYGIMVLKRNGSLFSFNGGINTSWSGKPVYNTGALTYAQSNPSAIFVPSSINGLTNGRIWVSWHGTDSTDTTYNNVRVSYSDDGGSTWSAMTKLTSGNSYHRRYATVTADRNNEIFVLYAGNDATDSGIDVRQIENSAGTWGSEVKVASGVTTDKSNPSALFDPSFSFAFSSPLFIYVETGVKVGFYGTWYLNPAIPSAPSTVTAPSVVTAGQTATISWSAVTAGIDAGETATYQVDWLDNDTNTWVNLATNVSGTSTTVTIPSPRHAGSTQFRVRCYDGYDYGPYTTSANVGLSGLLGATVTDASVVGSAYDTSGNGGRKLVRLSNGTLIAAMKNGTTSAVVYKSMDNGTTWTLLLTLTPSSPLGDVSVVAVGNNFALMYGFTNAYITVSVYNSSGNLIGSATNVDSGQSSLGNVSLAYSSTDNTLHAAWASKNSTYANSFNIRYAKGTINSDGSVTWGTVQQLQTQNTSGQDNTNPSVVVRADGNPVILYAYNTSATGMIGGIVYNGTSWSSPTVYNANAAYAQNNPSAIFVPTSINGLTNGRIWVAWQGYDATITGVLNIRLSYSDDGGSTWSTMQTLTNNTVGSAGLPSLTANKNNGIYVVFQDANSGNNYDIAFISNNGSGWGTKTIVSGGTGVQQLPSAIFDLTLNFSIPLFIYQNQQTSKVGFYGTWKSTVMSQPTGSIGQKSDKTNVLTYTIFSDDTMGTVTESLNGTSVATKTLTSGTATTVALTQSQWDAIKYGLYKDTSANLNTLTVSMGSQTWTFTFDKRLATTDDILHAIQSVSDIQTTFLPSVKSQLANAITNAHIGTSNATDSWTTMVATLQGSTLKRWATGTLTLGAATNFTNSAGSTVSMLTAAVSGLAFLPSTVIIVSGPYPCTLYPSQIAGTPNANCRINSNSTNIQLISPAVVSNGSFTLPMSTSASQGSSAQWWAFE